MTIIAITKTSAITMWVYSILLWLYPWLLDLELGALPIGNPRIGTGGTETMYSASTINHRDLPATRYIITDIADERNDYLGALTRLRKFVQVYYGLYRRWYTILLHHHHNIKTLVCIRYYNIRFFTDEIYCYFVKDPQVPISCTRQWRKLGGRAKDDRKPWPENCGFGFFFSRNNYRSW